MLGGIQNGLPEKLDGKDEEEEEAIDEAGWKGWNRSHHRSCLMRRLSTNTWSCYWKMFQKTNELLKLNLWNGTLWQRCLWRSMWWRTNKLSGKWILWTMSNLSLKTSTRKHAIIWESTGKNTIVLETIRISWSKTTKIPKISRWQNNWNLISQIFVTSFRLIPWE